MAAEETPSYGRSSSRVSRAVQETSLEQRSLFGNTTAKKSQQKAASDKLVWFSPVRSPLLSPARDKTLQMSRKKVRNSSIFSIQSRAKGSVEAEEPTSPKVSCIGQVRASKNDRDPCADLGKKKIPVSRPGSVSPARFFTSPGRASKWGSLFGSRKDSCCTPSLSVYSGDYQPEKPDARGATGSYFDRYTHDAAESRVFGEARSFAAAKHNISRKDGASASEKLYDLDIHEDYKDSKKVTMHVEPDHTGKGVGPEVPLQEHQRSGKSPVSKQRLTYEELPSLHCGASMKPNMKISVEVVPETWLLRNEERSRPNSNLQSCYVPECSTNTSREDYQEAQGEQMSSPKSPRSKAQPHTTEGEQCAHIQDISDLTSVGTGSALMDNFTCKPSLVDGDREVDKRIRHVDEASVTVPSCSVANVCEEESKGIRSSGDEGGAHGPQLDKHQPLRSESPEGEADVEKLRTLLGSSELIKNRHRRLRRVSPDVGKKNFGIAIPQLFDKKSPSSAEDGKHLRSIFKGRKSDAFTAQPFSALILVGYDSPIASKDGVVKSSHDEELLKGILEVGRLSFHSSGRYFQVLKGDAAFIRSRSATSHRPAITLPRCNSDPCRPSY